MELSVFLAFPIDHQNEVSHLAFQDEQRQAILKGNFLSFLLAINFVFFFPGCVNAAHKHHPGGAHPTEFIGEGKDQLESLGEGASSACPWL